MSDSLRARRLRLRTRVWTRKLHNYLGLALLAFLWLFAVSGLVLNHSSWKSAQFWKERRESTAMRSIHVPVGAADVAMAADVMRQLSIVGEIMETKRSPDGARFEFQVVKPGRVARVEAQLDSAHALVTNIQLNAWGVVDALHKFTGVRMDDPGRSRDWIFTRLWSGAMDVLSIGMIVLVVSGIYLWYRGDRARRRLGLLALIAGLASCAFFVYGIAARLP